MKIKLAILEKDQSYLKRIVSVFNTKYSDKIEVYSFTDIEKAIASLDEARIDVFVSTDAYEVDQKRLPKRCGFAYLVDSSDVETVNEQRAICWVSCVGYVTSPAHKGGLDVNPPLRRVVPGPPCQTGRADLFLYTVYTVHVGTL